MTTAAASLPAPRLPLRTWLRRQAAYVLVLASLGSWSLLLLSLFLTRGKLSWKDMGWVPPLTLRVYLLTLIVLPLLAGLCGIERPWMTRRRRLTGIALALLPCLVAAWMVWRALHVDALYQSAFRGNQPLAAQLLHDGVSPNVSGRDCVLPNVWFTDSPLQIAVRMRHAEMVRLLVQHGARVDKRGSWGTTPLDEAAVGGDCGVLKELLAGGADVNARRSKGVTALSIAGGHPAAVRLLLENGADVHVRDDRGWTPLMIAAYHGRTGAIPELLQHGAPVNDRDAQGRTALSLARRRHHADTVEALQSAGAR